MRGFKLVLAVSLVPLLGCGIRQALEGKSYAIPGVDYGPVPTNYDHDVEHHIQSKYDQDLTTDGWVHGMGPFEGSIRRTRGGELETVYGWEVHVWFSSNEKHYMVLIRDGMIVGSEYCGSRSGGFDLLDFSKPSC